MTKLYECTFIMRQDIPSQDVHKIADKFVGIITATGGELKKKEYWGLRTLAYPIKKNKKGHYVMLVVSATDTAIKDFERNCKIDEDIIKYVTFGVETFEEAPSPMMQAPADISDLSSNA